jgi:hypothetical protein
MGNEEWGVRNRNSDSFRLLTTDHCASEKSIPRGCLVKCWLANLVKTRVFREAFGHHLCSRRARGALRRDFAQQIPHEMKPWCDRPMVNIAPQPQISAPRARQALAAPRLRVSAVHFMHPFCPSPLAQRYANAIGQVCVPQRGSLGQPRASAAARSRKRSPGFPCTNKSQAPTGRLSPVIDIAPLGLSANRRSLPRPALRLAWADLGCPFGAHFMIRQQLNKAALRERPGVSGERNVVHLPIRFQKTVKTVKNGRKTVNKRIKNGAKTDENGGGIGTAVWIYTALQTAKH